MTDAGADANVVGRGDDAFREVCSRAIEIAAADLGLDRRAFAEELAQGEIGLLVSYLRDAAPAVGDLALRARIEALLHRLTARSAEPE